MTSSEQSTFLQSNRNNLKKNLLCHDCVGQITEFLCSTKTFFKLYALSKTTQNYFRNNSIVTKNIVFVFKPHNFFTKKSVEELKEKSFSFVCILKIFFPSNYCGIFNSYPLFNAMLMENWFFNVFSGLKYINIAGINESVGKKLLDISSTFFETNIFVKFLNNLSMGLKKFQKAELSLKRKIFCDDTLKINTNELNICKNINKLYLDFDFDTKSFIGLLQKMPNLKVMGVNCDLTRKSTINFADIKYVHKNMEEFYPSVIEYNNFIHIGRVFPSLKTTRLRIEKKDDFYNEKKSNVFVQTMKNLEELSIYITHEISIEDEFVLISKSLKHSNLKIFNFSVEYKNHKQAYYGGNNKINKRIECISHNLSKLSIQITRAIGLGIPLFVNILKSFFNLIELDLMIENHDNDGDGSLFREEFVLIKSLQTSQIKCKKLKVFMFSIDVYRYDFLDFILNIVYSNFLHLIFLELSIILDDESEAFDNDKWGEEEGKLYNLKKYDKLSKNKLKNLRRICVKGNKISFPSYLMMWNNSPNVESIEINEDQNCEKITKIIEKNGMKLISKLFEERMKLKELKMIDFPTKMFVMFLCKSSVEMIDFLYEEWDFKYDNLSIFNKKGEFFTTITNVDFSSFEMIDNSTFLIDFITNGMKKVEQLKLENINSKEQFENIFVSLKKLKHFTVSDQQSDWGIMNVDLPFHKEIEYFKFKYNSYHKAPKGNIQIVSDILNKFENLKELYLEGFVSYLNYGKFLVLLMNLEKNFENIKVLELKLGRKRDEIVLFEYTFQFLYKIFKKFPNLKELILPKQYFPLKEQSELIKITHDHVETIVLDGFKLHKNIQEIKTIINICKKLKKFVVGKEENTSNPTWDIHSYLKKHKRNIQITHTHPTNYF